MANVRMVYLRYVGGTSDKFYTVFTVNELVVCNYGRYGAAGQWVHTAHDGAFSAARAGERTVAEKRAKGYTLDGTFVFEIDDDLVNADNRNRLVAAEHVLRQHARDLLLAVPQRAVQAPRQAQQPVEQQRAARFRGQGEVVCAWLRQNADTTLLPATTLVTVPSAEPTLFSTDTLNKALTSDNWAFVAVDAGSHRLTTLASVTPTTTWQVDLVAIDGTTYAFDLAGSAHVVGIHGLTTVARRDILRVVAPTLAQAFPLVDLVTNAAGKLALLQNAASTGKTVLARRLTGTYAGRHTEETPDFMFVN